MTFLEDFGLLPSLNSCSMRIVLHIAFFLMFVGKDKFHVCSSAILILSLHGILFIPKLIKTQILFLILLSSLALSPLWF